MPAVETPQGQWLYDTTPTIQWFETVYPDTPITPKNKALAFVSLLLEDYGDEWLWRPAMWWRWMPPVSRRALGTRIMKGALGAPALWWYFAQRQSREWLWGDGMTKDNSDAVRDMYFEELEFLEAVFAKQALFWAVIRVPQILAISRQCFAILEMIPIRRKSCAPAHPTLTHGWHACGTPKRRLWVPSNIGCFRKGVTGRRFWTALPMITFPI